MEDQFKEIEGLLETTTHPSEEPNTQNRIKKYLKLAFPHVALVAVVCLYAVIGAYIFYRLESPNEDRLKNLGKNTIGDMRGHLIGIIREVRPTKRVWKESVEGELYRMNDKIYRAFKEQYVRYSDVRVSQLRLKSIEQKQGEGRRYKRHRNPKSRADKGEKLWTASSALFFAATTMATIGYGNIVPATSSGRIACVVFALFGAPLAIITIGDLGKFLSECTIWLYKKMKKGKVTLRNKWRRLRGTSKGNMDDIEEQSESSSQSALDWEDLVMDKTEVPVLMVFTILLLYIAFGGILFSFLEGWSYMDAFYYSFISLTTIGFGDIVPENHDYIVLMLIYLGVGLAVTTMCIDLVGIQYIQKIHYFGRKFRGTDLLQLLKRKRMIERRLAMGQGEEILHMYMQQIQKEIPPESVVDHLWDEEEKEKVPSPVEWQIDDALKNSRYSFNYPLLEKVPSPNVLSIRSFHTPSIYSNSSASARSMMMTRYVSRGGSWDESGPSLSEHCSLSTEPSVHIRQAYWDNFRSPDPSVTSFEFDFPLPSPPTPDYHAIAESARRSRRVRSCPDSSFSFPVSSSPIGLACMEDWDSYIRMLEEYEKPIERRPSSTRTRSTRNSPVSIYSPSPTSDAEMRISPTSTHLATNVVPGPSCRETCKYASPPLSWAPSNESVDIEMGISSPSPTSDHEYVMSPTMTMNAAYRNSLPRIHTPPRQLPARPQKSATTPQPPAQTSPSPLLVSPQPITPPWYPSPPRITSPPRRQMAFALPPSPVTVILESETQLEVVVHEQQPETQTDTMSVMAEESSSEDEGPPGFDLDLGAFELVDSGLTAEALLSTEDPVIFHKDMPVHSVHHDTVQTEAALANLMAAPASMLTAGIPPIMVEDNYCFVVDGDSVRMGDILGDDQWWRHTSRPTKFFYSEDLKQFHRVNCITAKGKVITAKLAGGTMPPHSSHAPSSSSTPRSSVSGSSSRPQSSKVPLQHVYKVIRFYSFWKTCTSFHRIVTMIDKVSTDDRNANPGFKKRLFVQYLWRNAKAVEKARVQKEFDPRRQRLLRFVTDPAARKRFQKM